MNYGVSLYDGISIEYGTDYQQKKKLFIVYPWVYWKKIWDIFIGGIKMYYCFAIPYYLGFDNNHEGHPIGLDTFFDVVLFFDILLKPSTAFIKESKLIVTRGQIFLKSLQDGIIIDVICVVPWYVVYDELMWFRVLRLMQLQTLNRALQKTVSNR